MRSFIFYYLSMMDEFVLVINSAFYSFGWLVSWEFFFLLGVRLFGCWFVLFVCICLSVLPLLVCVFVLSCFVCLFVCVVVCLFICLFVCLFV